MSKIRIYILLGIATLCVIYAFIGKPADLSDANRAAIILGIATSIVSNMLWKFFLPKDDSEFDSIALKLSDRLSPKILHAIDDKRKHFHRVDRNFEMGQAFWIDLIDELSDPRLDAIFVGTTLSLWHEHVYRAALIAKLRERFRKSSKSQFQICVHDSAWSEKWKKTLVSELGVPPDKVNSYVILMSQRHIPYSYVCVGQKMAITNYTFSGRAVTSITLDVIFGTEVWNSYQADIRNYVVDYIK